MAREPKKANLDALLPRTDLFEDEDTPTADTPTLRITDLEPSVWADMLRKPDFQRETSAWGPEQIAGLVQTFCDADIIPAIILWQQGNKIFVIDGAHRLSALMAWIRDDYGAGPASLKMFQGKIPEQQRLMDEQTRTLIHASVGPWSEYIARYPTLRAKSLQIQWIVGHSAKQAAKAFIRINQGGTVIDNLEVRMLQAARSALSMSTRVIANAGVGHPYWSRFTNQEARNRTPGLGLEIFKLLYEPKLEVPIKTLDVPLAGLGYGAGVIRLAFDLVALSNCLSVPDSTRKKPIVDDLPDDVTGVEAVTYLRKARRVVRLINSTDASSLGLHPALYCYTASGAFQPAALLNVVAWALDMEARDRLDKFRSVRGSFEDLLLAHPAIMKPAVHKLGSGKRTRSKQVALLNRAIDLLFHDASQEKAWEVLLLEHPYLRDEIKDDDEGGAGKPFSSAAKSAVSLSDLGSASRCPLCRGLLHRNGKVVDHTVKKADGGSSHSKNGRWVHPICNSNRDKDEAKAAQAS